MFDGQKIGIKWRSTIIVFTSLNVDGVSTGLDQATAAGKLAPESSCILLMNVF